MTTILSGSRSEWLLAVPYSANEPQGDAFRNHGGHQIEWDGRTPEDSKRSLPPVLPTMAGSMEQVCVCVCARVLLWRWLVKRCHMSYHYSAIPHFRELSDCSLYGRGMCTWSCLESNLANLYAGAFLQLTTGLMGETVLWIFKRSLMVGAEGFNFFLCISIYLIYAC